MGIAEIQRLVALSAAVTRRTKVARGNRLAALIKYAVRRKFLAWVLVIICAANADRRICRNGICYHASAAGSPRPSKKIRRDIRL